MQLSLLLILVLTLPSIAWGATPDEERVLTTYRAFTTGLTSDAPLEDFQALLSAESPLRKAARDDAARALFGQLREMLRAFSEEQVSATIEGETAEVVARGHAPVDDPQVRRFISEAAATYRVQLLEESDAWKVYNVNYKIRHSD